MLFGGYQFFLSPLAFDAERWKTAPLCGEDTTRGRMLDSLIASHPLIGLTKTQIVALLGLPPASTTAQSCGIPSFCTDDSHLCYWLGPGYISSDWLIITLKDNKVIAYETFSD
jgi:hypothetical protein